MIITLQEFERYTRDAPKYKDGLIFVQSGIEKEDTTCLVMWLRRLCQNTDGLSYMLVTSSHDSKDAIEKEVIHTGKVGRPRTVVHGSDSEKHCHGLIVNESDSVCIDEVKDRLSAYCKKRRKKRASLKRQKTMPLKGMQIVSYMNRQSDSEYKYGSFDFDYFKDIRFCDYPEENLDNILEFEEVLES
jgi:hypothetical protein